MQLTADQLEFAISQYVDGTLPSLELAALEERLATDPAARELFGEYQRLDSVVKTALPEPEVDWAAFQTQLNSRLAEVEAPVKHYRLSFGRVGWAVAAAASILIAIGVAIPLLRNAGHDGHVTTTGGSSAVAVAEVVGPRAEPSTQPAIAQVEIGAPPNMADAGWQSYEALIERPSRVVIAGAESVPDTENAPY
jgi:anti-sigma factor RsiW